MQLPRGGPDVPTADALVSIAMQLLRKGPGVLPCNRIGIATTDFVALSSKNSSISGLFGRSRVKTAVSCPLYAEYMHPFLMPHAQLDVILLLVETLSCTCRPCMRVWQG
jgi:hypothetical protein